MHDFLTGRLPFEAGLKTSRILQLHLDGSSFAILVQKQGADLFLMQGYIAISSTTCPTAYQNKFHGEYYYDLVLTPPNGETIKEVLVSRPSNLNDVIIGYRGLSSDQKQMVIFEHVTKGTQHGNNVDESIHIASYSAVSGTDAVGFFGQVPTVISPSTQAWDEIIENNTCSQWYYNPGSQCNSDLTRIGSPSSVLLIVGADIEGQKTLDLFDGRLASADSSSYPLNCCFLMDQGCSSELTGVGWLSHPSTSSGSVIVDSAGVTSGHISTTVCLKCNNKFMEIETGDFSITVCYPLAKLPTLEKVVHLAHDEQLTAEDAAFQFPPLHNPNCPQELTYAIIQSGNDFSAPELDESSGEYAIRLIEASIPFRKSFILKVTDGHTTYEEKILFEITQDPSPDAPFKIKAAPQFEGEIATVMISLEQAFEVNGEELTLVGSSDQQVEVPLPEVKAANGDSSRVKISISTEPALADQDLIKIEDSTFIIDLSKFRALDYAESASTLQAEVQEAGATTEATEQLSLQVTLSLEEEGVDLVGQATFKIEIKTAIIVAAPSQSSEDSEEEKEADKEIAESMASENEVQPLSEEEEAQLEEATAAIGKVTGIKASSTVPLYILKFFAAMLAEEQKALSEDSPDKKEAYVPPPPLTAWMDDVSTLGVVDIAFSHQLDTVLFKPEFISDRTLSVSLEQQTEEAEPNSMNWELVKLSSKGMKIQLGFENAILVSSGEERDILRVAFENNFLFRSFEHQQYLATSQILASVPGQLPQTDAILQFDKSAAAAAESFKFITLVILLGQYLMKGLLKKILTAILALQIVVVYGKLGIKLPANIVNFLQKLAPFISFDLMSVLSPYIENLFTFDMTRQKEMAQNELKPALQDMGFKTFNSILNLGSLVIMLTLVLVQVAIFGLLYSTSRGCKVKARWLLNQIKSMKRALFFSQPITLALSGFMPIYTCIILCMQNPLLSESGEIASVALTVFELIPLVTLLGVGIAIALFSSREKREDPNFKRMWGRLYTSIRQDTRLQLSYFLVFILRRWIIVKAALSVQPQYSVMILQMMLATNIMMAIYLGHTKPKPSRFENRMELGNDLMATIAGYHLITFTEFTLDPELKFSIGWSFIGCIMAMLMVNFFFVFVGIGKSLYLSAIKSRRLYRRYGFRMKPRRQRPREDGRGEINSIASVLTKPQLEMVQYYKKYNLDLPEALRRSMLTSSAISLERSASICSLDHSNLEQQPTERSNSSLFSEKKEVRSGRGKQTTQSQFKKIESRRKKPKRTSDESSKPLEGDPLFDQLSSKRSELSSSAEGSFFKGKMGGASYSKRFSGVPRKNTQKTPKRKKAGDLSIIREESLSMDYSFFAV